MRPTSTTASRDEARPNLAALAELLVGKVPPFLAALALAPPRAERDTARAMSQENEKTMNQGRQPLAGGLHRRLEVV